VTRRADREPDRLPADVVQRARAHGWNLNTARPVALERDHFDADPVLRMKPAA